VHACVHACVRAHVCSRVCAHMRVRAGVCKGACVRMRVCARVWCTAAEAPSASSDRRTLLSCSARPPASGCVPNPAQHVPQASYSHSRRVTKPGRPKHTALERAGFRRTFPLATNSGAEPHSRTVDTARMCLCFVFGVIAFLTPAPAYDCPRSHVVSSGVKVACLVMAEHTWHAERRRPVGECAVTCRRAITEQGVRI
jgi:hypothetical protein